MTSDRCSLKRGRKIIQEIIIDDLFVNGKIDLEQFFPRLESSTGKRGIIKVQIAPNEQIFEFVTYKLRYFQG